MKVGKKEMKRERTHQGQTKKVWMGGGVGLAADIRYLSHKGNHCHTPRYTNDTMYRTHYSSLDNEPKIFISEHRYHTANWFEDERNRFQ